MNLYFKIPRVELQQYIIIHVLFVPLSSSTVNDPKGGGQEKFAPITWYTTSMFRINVSSLPSTISEEVLSTKVCTNYRSLQIENIEMIVQYEKYGNIEITYLAHVYFYDSNFSFERQLCGVLDYIFYTFK